MKIALKVAYLGESYYGLQHQPDLVTIDSVLRRALLKIGVINGDFCYAGRTDRGVSSIGQVIDFWIDEEKRNLAHPRVVNSHLPRDVWAWAWAEAPLGFSARWSALWREYRYFLYHPALDLEMMREGAECLKGAHDFRNFSSGKEDTVRNVLKLEVFQEGDLFVFDVRAEGFLWNMVRRMVSALEMVGSGEKDIAWIEDLLNPEINHGAPTAPAEGLVLMDVGYDGLEWQVDEYTRKKIAKSVGTVVRRKMATSYALKAIQMSMER